jgi:hypothetical protein
VDGEKRSSASFVIIVVVDAVPRRDEQGGQYRQKRPQDHAHSSGRLAMPLGAGPPFSCTTSACPQSAAFAAAALAASTAHQGLFPQNPHQGR